MAPQPGGSRRRNGREPGSQDHVFEEDRDEGVRAGEPGTHVSWAPGDQGQGFRERHVVGIKGPSSQPGQWVAGPGGKLGWRRGTERGSGGWESFHTRAVSSVVCGGDAGLAAQGDGPLLQSVGVEVLMPHAWLSPKQQR